MATFHSFEEIDAWKESRRLIRAIRSICKQKAPQRDFAFVDQITRATRSISANIAEGFEALSVREFIQFLGIAKRSCGETRSHLHDALDEAYISQQEFVELSDQTKKICSMIAKLIHYLQTINPEQKRTLQKPQPPTKNEKRINEKHSPTVS